jgi:multidrug resistance protein
MQPGLSSRDRGIVALLVVLMFVSGADFLVVNPTLPQMARDLEVDVEIGSLWVTAYAAATATFALVFGPVSDRFGRRRVLSLGLLVLTTGTVACGFAATFEHLFAARFVAGIGAGMIVTSNTSYVSDHFEPRERAVAMGWVMSGFFLSLVLAVPLGAFLADQFGWRLMFVAIGGAAAAVWVTTTFILPDPRHEHRTSSLNVRTAARTYAALLKDPRVLGVLIQSLSIGIAMTMLSVYTSPWLEQTYGMSTLDRGLVYTVGGPALLIGGPLSGRLANRLGRVRVITRGSVTMAVLLIAMPASAFLATGAVVEPGAASGPPWLLAAPTLVIFFGIMCSGSIRAGPFFTLAMEVVDPGRRGAMSAIRNTFNHVGSAVGASLGALVWAYAPARYAAVCTTAAVVTLAGILLLRRWTGVEDPATDTPPSERVPPDETPSGSFVA